MRNLILGLFVFSVQSTTTVESEPFSIEGFRQILMGSQRGVRDIAPIRQADIGFIVEKSWVEKDNQGQFNVMSERVCTRRARANVYDVRNQVWNYPNLISLANCQTILDARDGSAQYEMTIDLGGFIYLNKNPDGREMKNFVPWALPRAEGGPKWPMQGFLMTPSLDLQETAFNFGSQSEQFYKNQIISVTVSFADRGN